MMLNPSRADEAVDDPTLRACIQFAQRWQYASLSVVNLFGYRTPHPAELKQATDPIGPENEADKVVLAWGNHGVWMGRDRASLQQLSPHTHKLVCLQQNKGGQPRHPLYVKREQPITPFVFN